MSVRTRYYYIVICVVSIIGSVISLGVGTTTLINTVIVTDAEYISTNDRELKSCEQDTFVKEQAIKKIPQEIKTCKTETTQKILAKRGYDQKTTGVSSLIWFVLCAGVYLTHRRGLHSL